MGMDFKVNEYGEIIRDDNELFSLEQKYLKGAPLNIEVRKRLAAESQNLQVLEACLKERAITVRRIVWNNPHLTPEMRMEATRQKLLDKKSAANSKGAVKPAARTNELARYEDAMLRGEELSNSMRRKVARVTRNEKVLWMCIRDTVKTVVTAAKENPILTSEMKTAISEEEKAWEQLKQYKIQEEVRRLEELEKNSKDDNGNKGCLWFIIIACALGALFSYLSGEMWFPF